MTAGNAGHDAFGARLDRDLLIEASAGTGKTWTLTTLVARLIVERQVPIERILLVTFTIAATGELQDRVRRVLQRALRARAGAPLGNDQADQLRIHWRNSGVFDDDVERLLRQALRDFDRSTITTIHGFCQRALAEFALPARVPFQFDVSGDDLRVTGDAVRDFWRQRMVAEDMKLLEYARESKLVPNDDTIGWVADHAGRLQEIRPGKASDGEVEVLRTAWLDAVRDAEKAWADQKTAFVHGVRPENWYATSRPGILPLHGAVVEAFETGKAAELRPDVAGAFGKSALHDQRRSQGIQKSRRGNVPDVPLFDHLERIGAAGKAHDLARLATGADCRPATRLHREAWAIARRRKLLVLARATIHRNAWASRDLTFDSLLVELHRALTGPEGQQPDSAHSDGGDLASRIRHRYPVALIDEFQDTDRLQAEIFQRIYPPGEAGDRMKTALIVVGDPKQSIYRFRGADVFAYLEYRRRIERQAGHQAGRTGAGELRLDANWRSTPELIAAVNLLFDHPQAFVLPEPAFSRASAARQPEDQREALVLPQGAGRNGTSDMASAGGTPFELRLIGEYEQEAVDTAGPTTTDPYGGVPWGELPPGFKKGRNKPHLTDLAARDAAREIERLIALGRDGKATIVRNGRSRPVTGGDIAVLARKNTQGTTVARALRELGIDSVVVGTENVLQSEQATDLYRLMKALCAEESDHQQKSLLCGALAADLFGLEMEELAGLRDDDNTWGEWRERTRDWVTIWADHGIVALIRLLLFGGVTNGSANLLRYPDGPRRLTNYLHLADLLHERETRERASRHGLLEWLRQSRADSREAIEKVQLRLDSDEDLVKIVTMHRAKGLEFPIVFCPFAWDGHERKNQGPADHYDPQQRKAVLDLDPSDKVRQQERLEDRADDHRLLYVALTRARFRCVVTWANGGGFEHTPLAWLLHRRSDPRGGMSKALADHASQLKALSLEQWRAEVTDFAARSGGSISVSDVRPQGVVGQPATATKPSGSAGGEDPQAAALVAKRFKGQIKRIRQRTSYSALSSGGTASAPVRDSDEVDDGPPEDGGLESPRGQAAPGDGHDAAVAQGPEEAPRNVHTFPAGGRAGRCLHDILEKRLITSPEAVSDEAICHEALARHGIGKNETDRRAWVPVARKLLANALDTRLIVPGSREEPSFTLRDLKQPVTELEFHLPLHSMDCGKLAACLEHYGYQPRLQTDRPAIDGFLHGYIDLVARHDGRWYVMDYKSNRLGPNSDSYDDAALEDAMQRTGYHLQFLLYLTALHRLLKLRLGDSYSYKRDVGGVLYLFLRGMNPHDLGSGVFHDRPEARCIEEIDACCGRPQEGESLQASMTEASG